MAIFNRYAEAYDLLYQDKAYDLEAKFVADRLLESAATVGGMLDLGCGTGLHALSFAKSGWRVRGVDASKSMIETARTRLAATPLIADRVDFEVGDVRSQSQFGRYDAVVSLFHVASYLLTVEDLRSMLCLARKSLDPGGVILFDYWYGPAVVTQGIQDRAKKVERENISVVRTAKSFQRQGGPVVDVEYDLSIADSSTGSSDRFLERHSLRYWFDEEIADALRLEGFIPKAPQAWLSSVPASADHWAAYSVATAA